MLTILIMSGVLVFLLRFDIINWVQQQKLRSISKDAKFANRIFASNATIYSTHRIYDLKGIERIWPHRVNSLKRFHLIYHEFAGFECDIRFNPESRKLLIAHDPSEINDLTWDQYLQDDPEKKLFWLDIKNVDQTSIDSFSALINHLDEQFNVKNRIIIESSDTIVLSHMERLGFLTSYYLPIPDLNDSIATGQFIKISQLFLEGHRSMISQDFSKLDFMNKNFPSQMKITWDLGFWNSMNKQKLLGHCKDSTILICLINVKSRGYL